jgi:hypothetical protein
MFPTEFNTKSRPGRFLDFGQKLDRADINGGARRGRAAISLRRMLSACCAVNHRSALAARRKSSPCQRALEQTKMYVGWAIPSPNGKYLALWQASGNSNVWMVEKF